MAKNPQVSLTISPKRLEFIKAKGRGYMSAGLAIIVDEVMGSAPQAVPPRDARSLGVSQRIQTTLTLDHSDFLRLEGAGRISSGIAAVVEEVRELRARVQALSTEPAVSTDPHVDRAAYLAIMGQVAEWEESFRGDLSGYKNQQHLGMYKAFRETALTVARRVGGQTPPKHQPATAVTPATHVTHVTHATPQAQAPSSLADIRRLLAVPEEDRPWAEDPTTQKILALHSYAQAHGGDLPDGLMYEDVELYDTWLQQNENEE